MFDFLKRDTFEFALLITIVNGSIDIASVLFGHDKPKFLYTSRHHFVVLEKPDAKELSDSVMRTLDEILSDFSKKGFDNKYWDYKEKRISNVLVALSSPWFIPKIKHLQISKNSLFTISHDFIDEILEKEEGIFIEELKKEDGNKKESFDVIEKSIVNLKINGYILKKNIGKITKNFDAYLRISVVESEFLRRVDDIVQKYIHISSKKTVFHTFPLISFSVARDIFSNNSNFILLDVTGEVTDLTLVQNDSVVAVSSFPSGRNYIIRKIATSFNTTFELAESTLRLYISKKLEDDGIKKLEEVITQIEAEWAVYFENSLLELSPQMVLPYKFYITADSDVSEIYKNYMSLSKTDTTSVIRRNMELIHIGQTTLSNFYENESLSQVSEFVAILAIFYNSTRKGVA